MDAYGKQIGLVLVACAALTALWGCGPDGPTRAELKAAREQALKRAREAENRISTLEDDKRELNRELDSVHQKLTRCKEKQAELKASYSSQKSDLNEDVRGLQQQLSDQKQRAQEAEKKMAEMKEKVEALQNDVSGAADKLAEAGQRSFAAEKYDSAEVLLSAAVQLGSTDPLAAYALGFCRARASDYENATKWYERAVSTLREEGQNDKTTLTKALNNLGAALTKQKKPEEAAKMYREAISVDDTFAPAHFNLALLYRDKLDQPDKALQHLRRHIALGGSRSVAAREAIEAIQSGNKSSDSAGN